MATSITLTPEQEEALGLMLSGANVFLTGEAGTGKSTILRKFREQCRRSCVFLAPTGIAAINVNGSTLHSFFLLTPGLLTPDSMEEINNKKRIALIRKTQTIVIDEISMVRSDTFVAIDHRLRSLATQKNKNKPFGGKQMILVGDFFQLPPVIKTMTEENYLMREIGGIYAFQTQLWRDAKFRSIFLKTVHRQENDTLFLSILNKLRHGKSQEADFILPGAEAPLTTLEALNRLCINQEELTPPPIYLCTTRREEQTINMMSKSKIAGNNILARAIVTGKFPERDYPTQPVLELKIGARIMLLNNKRLPDGTYAYVNGDLGVITGINSTTEPSVQVMLDNGRYHKITPYQWTAKEYELETNHITGKEVIRQREVGSFFQLPLKPAYAITIHKAQGLSLERCFIKLGNGCFAHGQLYTAISRCRSIKKLRLDRPLLPEDIILDSDVIDFYEEIEHPEHARKNQEVTLCVPKKYEAEVLALLARLKGENTASPTAEHATPANISAPPQSQSPPVSELSNRIYEHPDLNKLMIVYHHQTAEEQSMHNVKEKNGLGFNLTDAPILTPIAEHYKTLGYVTKENLTTVSRRIKKYHRQWKDDDTAQPDLPFNL